MPTLMVHITALQELGREGDLNEGIRELIRQYPESANFGAIFPDLPYYRNFSFLMLKYMLGFNLPFPPWGYIFHATAPATFGRRLVEVLRREHIQEYIEHKLAFIAGYFSHLALDSTIHPLVITIIREEGGKDENHARKIHGECEKYQSLFLHKGIYGYDILGTSIVKEKIRIIPDRSNNLFKIKDSLLLYLRKTCLETYSNSPSNREFKNWLRGVYLYARVLSSPMGRLEGLKGEDSVNHYKYFKNERFSYTQYYEKAKILACHYINLAFSLWERDVINDNVKRWFMAQIPDGDLSSPIPQYPKR